jgi:hypothetical protein
VASNGGAVPQFCRKIGLALITLSLGLSLGGCTQVTFEPVDRRGHVQIVKGDEGYCFRVPFTPKDKKWEIREKLEEVDVVCLAPLEDGFRDSIVARSLPARDLEKPDETIRTQLEGLGTEVTVVEGWSGADKPVVVTLEESKFSKEPLAQLLYIHLRSGGDGVLIVCTTKKDKLDAKRAFFEDIVADARYELTDCTHKGVIPDVFPTPEATLRPL